MRMTRQREIIIEELCKVDTHPSADKIFRAVKKRLPRISLGTVYRNLEIMSENNLIRKIELGGLPKRFDGNTETHYHIRCTRCDRIEDVKSGDFLDMTKVADALKGYEVVGHKLEFAGICPECRKNKK